MFPFMMEMGTMGGFNRPPTIFSLLNSFVNYDNNEYTKIVDLARKGRNYFFDFEYPLSSKINKEDFEIMILNKFMQRRIGFETPISFKLQLQVKLNEIMPIYNKMFDMLEGWDIFNDGEIVKHELFSENNQTNNTNSSTNSENKTTNNSSNELNNSSSTSSKAIADSRSSDTPQNLLDDIKAGKYVDKFGYNQNENSGEDSSESKGKSQSSTINNQNSSTENNSNIQENNKVIETTTRNQGNKLETYTQFIKNKQNIYSLIFKDLECLFYQLI